MTTRWRIVHLLATRNGVWGGMERHVADLTRAQCDAGHDVHLIADPSLQHHFPHLTFQALSMGPSRYSPRLYLQLRQHLQAVRPHITHAHGNKAARILSLQASALAGATVGTLHGIKSSDAAFHKLNSLITLSGFSYERANHPHKTMIYHGLPLRQAGNDQAAPALAANHWQRPWVLAVGRLEPVKGFDRLLEAWARLSAPGHLVILGEGSQRFALEQRCRQPDLAGRVTLAGYREDARAWLQHADLCVVSSLREGFCYVLAEALLEGCPVLSTATGIAADILPATSLAADASVESLLQLLQTQLPDLAQLKQAQADARAYARQTLTLTAMAHHTDDCYQATLDRTRSHDRPH
ncbi:MAG: glycosyltransferase [Marinobacter sp.]|nr:glycosyltransferase [Marinobacter sp.]